MNPQAFFFLNLVQNLSFLPKIRADCCQDISVTGKCLAVIHFYDDVSELRFIVQGFQLLEHIAGMDSIYPVEVGTWRCPILYL